MPFLWLTVRAEIACGFVATLHSSIWDKGHALCTPPRSRAVLDEEAADFSDTFNRTNS